MDTMPDIAFDELLQALKQRGFALTPNDYVEFTAIFHQFTGSREQLKYYLAPILCRNKEEQAKFYALYDAYLSRPERPRPPVAPPQPLSALEQKIINSFLRRAYKKYYFWILLFSLVAGLVRLAPLLHRRQEVKITVPLNPDSIHIEQQTVQRPGRVFVAKAGHTSKGASDSATLRSRILASGAPVEKENTVHSTAFAWLLVLGLTGLALSLSFFPLRKSKLLPHVDINKPGGDDMRMDIPFLPKDHLIQTLPVLARIARDLAQVAPTEVYRLDIHRTIRESIRSYGLLTPVYENIHRRPEYLVLIDKRSMLQASLFQYLARTLVSYSVPLDYYFYDGDSLFYPQTGAKPINAYSLRQRHAQARWMLLGNSIGYSLWDTGLAEFLTSGIPKPLRAEFNFTFSVRPETVDKLRYYLGDEDLFQWVCAVAVYPTVRWEVLLAVGASVLKERKATHKLNFANLLKLTSIEWLSGPDLSETSPTVIPTPIRLELLKALGLPEELVARETILQLLHESDGLLAEHAEGLKEKNWETYTQSFILFAHDPRRNKTYEQDARKFMSVWNRRQAPDLATVLYLTNPDQGWNTPIRSVDHPSQLVGADKFINELLALKVIHNPVIRAFFRNTGLSFLFLLFLLFLFKDIVQPMGINQKLGLIDHDYPNRAVTVIIPVNTCLKKMLSGGRHLLVTLNNYDNNNYSQMLDLENKDTARVSFGDITMAGKDPGKQVFQLILNKTLTIDCPYKEYYLQYVLQLQGDDCEFLLPVLAPGYDHSPPPETMQQ